MCQGYMCLLYRGEPRQHSQAKQCAVLQVSAKQFPTHNAHTIISDLLAPLRRHTLFLQLRETTCISSTANVARVRVSIASFLRL